VTKSRNSEFVARLTVLLPQVIAWVTQQSQLALKRGVRSADPGLAVARTVAVLRPEHIRVWTVVYILAPDDPEVRCLALEQNLIGPGTRGLTLGYGILIRQGEFDLRSLAHECSHVHQVEAGSLEAFLLAYLKQIADVGYDDAPYEVDARAHELHVEAIFSGV
jgi:hypothetical protein